MIGTDIHSYGTLTPIGELHARELWQSSRPPGAFGGPPRLARPYRGARSAVARLEDRACPNCAAHAGWLTRRRSKRWEELRGRGEADFTCLQCGVRWTVYLEPTGPGGRVRPARRADRVSLALALPRRLVARRRARPARPPPGHHSGMTARTSHQPCPDSVRVAIGPARHSRSAARPVAVKPCPAGRLRRVLTDQGVDGPARRARARP